MRTYRKFTKDQRSTFPYWFWHWLAFNDVARELHVWRPRHILHDIEKPFLRLIFPYKKVQKWHRLHNRHHLEYRYPERRSWLDMIIDWEASGRTKQACPRNAIEEARFKLNEGSMSPSDYTQFYIAWKELASRCPQLEKHGV